LFVVPLLLTCCPAVLSGYAFFRAFKQYRSGQIRPYVLWILAAVVLIPIYAFFIYIYFTLRPSPYRSPWEDSEILDLATLVLLAPIGFLSTMFAGFRGVATRVLIPLIAAMLMLFFLGFLAADSV
jgi:hypothetical protein